MRLQFVLPLLIAAAGAQAGTIYTPYYSNTTTDSGVTDSFSLNSLVEAGDQIQLSGGNVILKEAKAALYNSSDSSGTASSVTLRLYNVDGVNLGTNFATVVLNDVFFTANSLTTLEFDLDAASGADLVWTLAFTTSDSIALELPSYDPPTIGSSDNLTAWWDTGTGLGQAQPGFDTENYYLELRGTAATPEPGTLLLAFAGVLVILGLRRRGRPACTR
jgi:hypothetical protein